MPLSRRLLIAFILSSMVPATTIATEVQFAADWTLSTPNGQAINLADEAEKQTIVLFFWATWCPYCKALMPQLQSIRIEYGDSVKILAINIFEDADPVAFINDAGYDFTLLLEGDAVAENYGIFGTPGLFVIDANRRIDVDIRTLPSLNPPNNGKKKSHAKRADYLAPYWAAEVRKSIDRIESAGR
ncbi:MAG: TlpA family protein disulfide reductase [Proteobacteria bacterium]|nr:TlpA family protein disulfide reductase [Pseudomonadota bacterium]